MRSRNPFLRAGLTLASLAAVALVFAAVRLVQANGVFSSAPTGFSGTCKAIPLAGVADIEIDAPDHLALLAVLDGRHPGAGDGLYALDLVGSAPPKRLAGTPADFHPRGLGLYRGRDGTVTVAVVNHKATGRFSIDSFELTRKDGGLALAARNTVEGGLLSDPQDVALAAPDKFYVSNGVTATNAVMRALQAYGIWPGGDILLFNGMSFREAMKGLSGPRGLALTADGSHLLTAEVTGRDIVSLAIEDFTGNLTEAGSLALPSGPDRLVLTGNEVWAGAHANLFTWRSAGREAGTRAPAQIFRVGMENGVPKTAEQVYGDDGAKISGAAAGAAYGKRLFIGSPLDGKLLDCRTN